MLDSFESIFVYNMINHFNNPKLTCTKMNLCHYEKVENSFEDFKKVNLLLRNTYLKFNRCNPKKNLLHPKL